MGWFWRNPGAWLEDLNRPGKIVALTLDQVGRSDLLAWTEMMTLILDTGEDDIASALDRAYGSPEAVARLPAATLEERLAPEISRMRPRTSESPARSPTQQKLLTPASGR